MLDGEKMRIHGLPVIAWAKTEDRSDGPCGYVLVETRPASEWVVSWYRSGDSAWSSGLYYRDLSKAWRTFMEKVSPHMTSEGARR